jgi:hypothetical protein
MDGSTWHRIDVSAGTRRSKKCKEPEALTGKGVYIITKFIILVNILPPSSLPGIKGE